VVWVGGGQGWVGSGSGGSEMLVRRFWKMERRISRWLLS
jgi:hypothetical protein